MSSLAKVESRNSVEIQNRCSWVCCVPRRRKKYTIEPCDPVKTELPSALSAKEQSGIDKAAEKTAAVSEGTIGQHDVFANTPPAKPLW
jgi:hypothetical protein